ncbi:MAG: hypothetical protein ACRBEQ_14380 [Hyphomonas sp.]
MSFTRPRSLLDPDDVGVLILPNLPKDMTDKLNVLRTSQIDCFEIDSVNQPAWTDPKLWALMETPKWRQLLIIANAVSTYEIGLVTMALEKGFNVFFVTPNLDGTDLRSQRLQQASAILISIDDVIAELNIETPSGH